MEPYSRHIRKAGELIYNAEYSSYGDHTKKKEEKKYKTKQELRFPKLPDLLFSYFGKENK